MDHSPSTMSAAFFSATGVKSVPYSPTVILPASPNFIGIVGLLLQPGDYVIFGKLYLSNPQSQSTQTAVIRMVNAPLSQIIDESTLTLPAGAGVSVSLQAALSVSTKNSIIFLEGSGFEIRANVADVSKETNHPVSALIAIQVASLTTNLLPGTGTQPPLPV